MGRTEAVHHDLIGRSAMITRWDDYDAACRNLAMVEDIQPGGLSTLYIRCQVRQRAGRLGEALAGFKRYFVEAQDDSLGDDARGAGPGVGGSGAGHSLQPGSRALPSRADIGPCKARRTLTCSRRPPHRPASGSHPAPGRRIGPADVGSVRSPRQTRHPAKRSALRMRAEWTAGLCGWAERAATDWQ